MSNIISCMEVSGLKFSEGENAVHLDLSEGEYPFLDDGKSFNKDYFARIHNNAIQILQDLFQQSNTIDIVLLYYLYGDSFKKLDSKKSLVISIITKYQILKNILMMKAFNVIFFLIKIRI